MSLPRLYLNHIANRDRLFALEFGRVFDGQPHQNWHNIGDEFGFMRCADAGPIVGFGVNNFSTFDIDDPEVAPIWDAAYFHVPLLGLTNASAGEVIVAARSLLGSRSTFNRVCFSAACGAQDDDPESALDHWLACLETGDSMAHFGLGYTLFELERYHEAYRHLRYYAEISPAHPWNWCWFGKAAQAIGEVREAQAAYRRALELSDDPDETAAGELLRTLDHSKA